MMRFWTLCRSAALLSIGVTVSGCLDQPRSCDASKELDFSPLKGMAGTWKESAGYQLFIARNGRPHSFEQGSTFGCKPGQYPLVLNDPTFIQNHVGDVENTLTSALIEEGHFVLSYESDIGPPRIEARLLDASHLEYRGDNDTPSILTRICNDLCDPKTGLPLDEDSSE